MRSSDISFANLPAAFSANGFVRSLALRLLLIRP
jgi:hypothetical protein